MPGRSHCREPRPAHARLNSSSLEAGCSVRIVIYGPICYPSGQHGPSQTIRSRSPASMGKANSSTPRATWTESVRVRQAFEVLLDGHLPLGAWPAETSSRLPDYDGKTGGAACRMVFLEDGGHLPHRCQANVKEWLKARTPVGL